jgi:hypothetical protein
MTHSLIDQHIDPLVVSDEDVAAVPLREQLECASRELAWREKHFPGQMIFRGMKRDKALREIAEQRAIVRTLTRLLEQAA